MTTREEPQGGAEDVWPPVIERAPRPMSALAPDTELRRDRLALLLALTGIGLAAIAAVIGLGTLQLQPMVPSAYVLDALCVVYFLAIVCEVLAVVKGSSARGTRMGQWSLTISLFALTGFFLYAPFLIHIGGDTSVWPWQGQSDDNRCHEKMQWGGNILRRFGD